MQIGPMHVEELGTVQADAVVPQGRPEVDLPRLPVAADDALRKETDVLECLPQAQRA